MFFDQDLKGNRLPAGTVCLTYDDGPGETHGDGPGPRTRDLGQYLQEQGIPATFFVIGRCAESRIELLRQLRAWGHLVGNHTYSHPNLVDRAAVGGDVIGELARTEEILRQAGPTGTIFFRAPYGYWRQRLASPASSEEQRTSIVAEVLNASGRFPDHVGPVHWDISARDYEYWWRRADPKVVADAYLEKVEQIGQGIVLMHDSLDDPSMGRRNRSLEATQLLVPLLRARGYRFVRLDAIPQIQSAMRVVAQITLHTDDGLPVVLADGGRRLAVRAGVPEVFGLVRLAEAVVALRAAIGLYVSNPATPGPAVIGAPAIGEAETLHLEATTDRLFLRTSGGCYWACDRGQVVTRVSIREAEAFKVQTRFGLHVAP
jgi:peptidoglycan/xylan/chitin deacetylase (PgdA/CDA1 family)